MEGVISHDRMHTGYIQDAAPADTTDMMAVWSLEGQNARCFWQERNHNNEEASRVRSTSSYICLLRTNRNNHIIPPPYRTVPYRTNTYQYHTYIHTYIPSGQLRLSFFFLFFFVSPFPLFSILSLFLSLAISHFVGLYLRHSLLVFPLPSSLSSTLFSSP